MNIFFLHLIPRICAKYHVDRHVIKMILETCQLLCTAIWILGNEAPYKKTHENHPCAVWTRSSRKNWRWLRKLGLELCKEYTFRYNKIHSSEIILQNLKCPNLPDIEFTFPPQAMPDKYKCDNTIKAYRNYYKIEKKHLHYWKSKSGIKHAWKNRDIPKFILDSV